MRGSGPIVLVTRIPGIGVFEIGNGLRQARQRQQLAFADIEAATKIRAGHLDALEREEFERLPPGLVSAQLPARVRRLSRPRRGHVRAGIPRCATTSPSSNRSSERRPPRSRRDGPGGSIDSCCWPVASCWRSLPGSRSGASTRAVVAGLRCRCRGLGDGSRPQPGRRAFATTQRRR